jgi:hypothetical protein
MGFVSDKYRGTKEYFLVHAELTTAARYRGKVTYQHIAAIMGLPLRGNHMQREIGQILGEISEDEHNFGRPMLSAVVTNVERTPGSGFFGLAKSLGKIQDESDQALQQFWQEERERVYVTWQKEFKVT